MNGSGEHQLQTRQDAVNQNDAHDVILIKHLKDLK